MPFRSVTTQMLPMPVAMRPSRIGHFDAGLRRHLQIGWVDADHGAIAA